MFNKFQFNNLVISNKQKIRQGYVQTINHLVHKIRKLKSLIDKYPENTKFKGRLGRTELIFDHMKKMKCIDVIREVLLFEKNPTSVITNAESSLSETAVALFGNNKIIKLLAQMFKEQLNLSDDDTEWRDKLLEPSKKCAKIQKTEEKRRKRKEAKEKNQIARKRLQWLSENNSSLQQDEVNTIATDGGVWKVESIDQSSNDKITFNESDLKEKSQVTKSPSKVKKDRKTKLNESNKQKKKIDKQEKATKTLSSVSGLSSNSNEESLKVESSSTKTPKKAVDPFFITESGDYYLSTAIVPETKNTAEQETENNRKSIPKTTGKKLNTINSTKPYTNRKRINEKIDPHKDNKDQDQFLHPSWAAKKKLKPVITSFKGESIKFDEDGSIISNKEKTNSHSFTGKKEKDENHNMEIIHPSWAAKQKMKTSIVAFQGKKISFVDEEE